MSIESKIEIAQELLRLGVYETNVGYVSSIPDHAQFAREISKKCPDLNTSAYIRVYGEAGDFGDRVKFALDCGVDRIVILVPASEYQFKVRKTMNKWEVFKNTMLCLQAAYKAGAKQITIAPYDTSRTDLDYLRNIYKTAIEEGADRILAYDTLGVLNPQATSYWISKLRAAVPVPIQYHCHNDFGLAVANTCAAVTAGVEYIDIVVNGLGDRAGNACFEETILSLHGLYGINTGIDTNGLFNLSKLVSKHTNIPIPQNKPISGRNTFIHESDIHVAALLSGRADAFEPYDPELVGQRRTIYFGSTTSLDSLYTLADSVNVKLDENKAQQIMKKIKGRVAEIGFANDEEVRQFILESQ